MLPRTLALVSLVALCGCWKVNSLPGQCATTGDCTSGDVCDFSTGSGLCKSGCGDIRCNSDQICSNNVCIQATCVPGCTTGQTCELQDGGYHCIQTACVPACDTSYQECNTSANPPTCVATTCHPTCAANEVCSNADGGFTCIPLTTGQININSPDGGVFGIVTPLGVVATAGAPAQGPTKVDLAVEQGAHSASIEVDVGNNGVYSGNIGLADAGFTTGAAHVVGTVYWVLDGGELDASSPLIAIEIDADPPAFGAPSSDKTFYSGVATPAQTAHVSIAVTDAPAGVNPSSVKLTVAGKAPYPADPNSYPDGGSGVYNFALPAGDLGTSTSQIGQVPYLVTAIDKVGNAATFDGGALSVDNVPPTITAITYDAGTWFGGDAGVSISADVQDQVSGSGLNPSSVVVALSGNGSIANATTVGNVYTFATIGSALQGSGQQGPVPFAIAAQDKAGNSVSVDGGALLIDLLAPTAGATTVTAGRAPQSAGGWFAQDGGTARVVAIINDGNGSGPASASLLVGNGPALTATSGSIGDTGTSYTFTVPTMVQSALSETPLGMTIAGTDAVGNSATPTAANDGSGNTVFLKIDGEPPQITGAAVITPADGVDGTGEKWFNQSGTGPSSGTGPIQVTATIVDNGSLVNGSSVALQTLAGAAVSGVTVSGPVLGVYTFSIPRVGAIASGAQGTLSLQVFAKDNVGNPSTLPVPPFGIDGQKPSVSFATTLVANAQPAYPSKSTSPALTAAQLGCDPAVDFCGHDGAHFWCADDKNLLSFYGSDGAGGSGVPAQIANGTLSIGSGTAALTSSESGANSTTEFDAAADFSGVAFTTAADGTGAASVTATVRDLVGNSNSTTISVGLTRVKWIKKMAAKVDTFAGSPIVTSTPAPQIILGGNDKNAGGPIVSFDPNGAQLWRLGNAASVNSGSGISSITSNMAYSPSTKNLYVVTEGGTTVYAFNVVAGAAPTAFATYPVTGGGTTGSPTLLEGGGSEYMVFADKKKQKLYSVNCVAATGGASCALETALSTGTWTTSLTAPTTDGVSLYLGHDSSGLSKVGIDVNGNLTYGSDATSFTTNIVGSVAIANNLFLADKKNSEIRYRSATTSPSFAENTAGWAPSTTASGMSAADATPAVSPVVSSSYVFGSFDSSDGHFYAFSNSTGLEQFVYPAAASAGLGNFSAPTLGADSTIYVGDDTNAELLALKASISGTATRSWSFTGTTLIPVTGMITEPTIGTLAGAARGTIYFGDTAGSVFALITDSAGPLAPAKGANWPRVGFDNCNSGNSSFSCQ